MTKLQIQEVNGQTGQAILRDMTDEEIDQHEKDLAEKEQRKIAVALRHTKKMELLAKLGITQEEADVLLS